MSVRDSAKSYAVMGALLLSALVVACGSKESSDQRASRTGARDTSHGRARIEVEAAGEVATDSIAAPRVAQRWITDANVLSLVSALNAKQIQAVDVELESWHVDTVRSFAATMAHEHAELQRGLDSIAEHSNLTPVRPALAKPWLAVMQAHIDTIQRASGGIDRAFVRDQVTSHQLMSDYLSQLADVAERADLRAFLQSAAARSASQSQRARSLQTMLAAADSADGRREGAPRRPPVPQ